MPPDWWDVRNCALPDDACATVAPAGATAVPTPPTECALRPADTVRLGPPAELPRSRAVLPSTFAAGAPSPSASLLLEVRPYPTPPKRRGAAGTVPDADIPLLKFAVAASANLLLLLRPPSAIDEVERAHVYDIQRRGAGAPRLLTLRVTQTQIAGNWTTGNNT